MDIHLDDADFCDIGEETNDIGENEETNEATGRVNTNGVKVRGPDLSWIEVKRFPNVSEFSKSEYPEKFKSEFSLRKKREYDWADVYEYDCKFKRRIGFLPCSLKMKL